MCCKAPGLVGNTRSCRISFSGHIGVIQIFIQPYSVQIRFIKIIFCPSYSLYLLDRKNSGPDHSESVLVSKRVPCLSE